MVLHTVNKGGESLARCLSLVAAGDAVLLLEDGVYAGMEAHGNESTWQGLTSAVACYALESDLAARGLSDKMLPRFQSVSWQQFVALAVEYDKVLSWG